MKKNIYNPEIHHRRSIRLKAYEYSSEVGYSICVKNRECLFGELINGEMFLSDIGIIIKNEWLKTEQIHENIIMDELIIMPNHLHGIIFIKNQEKGRMRYAPTETDNKGKK